ncbi:MAG: hypothetical protein AB7H70_13405 [Rhodospirillaceae bacterium]
MSENNSSRPNERTSPILVKVSRAAEISGYPKSFIRKTFIREELRPKNIPPPPPHQRRGRAVDIYADQIPTWVKTVEAFLAAQGRKGKRGRPTVAERIAQRQATSAV